jgi:hypothetical protein
MNPFCLQPTGHALKVVNKLFKSSPNPLSTKEIYNLALTQKPGPSFHPIPRRDVGISQRRPMPPNPNHPIRSVRYVTFVHPGSGLTSFTPRYLKKIILPTLEAQKKIEKFHTKLVPDEAVQPQATSVPVRLVKKNKSKAVSPSAPVDVWLWRWVAGAGAEAAAEEDVGSRDAETRPQMVERGYVTRPDALLHLNKRRQRARLKKEKMASG